MPTRQTAAADVTVVGGGLAGVCAAVAAARLGKRVSLINNRPVLGGNSSSEVRVWVCGATGHGTNRYAREGGIMGELFVRNQYRNPEGNPYLWDLTVLEAVRAEDNITLFLNTDVRDVEADGPDEARVVRSVTGWTMGSERETRFDSPIYLDCTGDGLVGELAGAHARIGRESVAEYGEAWAPETPDRVTLGSTLLFYTKDAGEPVEFVPPPFARDVVAAGIPENRIIRSGDNGCAYWWIEWGGALDTVQQNEQIRDELWAVIYGIWDYIKNSGRFEAQTMTLEWVGALPGKREYRRLIGDYTLTQQDILAQRDFTDAVAFGGWSIDLHPPGGVYATERGSKHWYADGVYPIPYRSLYSVNVTNLLMAGRNISASHVAFGSTRVMATCATLGEAAGTAAALCVAHRVDPRTLGAQHGAELTRTLLRQDASVIGVAHEDARDLARSATITASSELTGVHWGEEAGDQPLDTDTAILLPVDPALHGLSLVVSSAADTQVTVTLHATDRPQNIVPGDKLSVITLDVPAGDHVRLPLGLTWQPERPANALLVIGANPVVRLPTAAATTPGVLAFAHKPWPHADEQPQALQEWPAKPWHGRVPLVAFDTPSSAWSVSHVLDGIQRPYGGPHLWASAPMQDGRDEWVSLQWHEPQTVAQVEILFDDDVNEDLINLHHHRTPHRVLPTLVRDYVLERRVSDRWEPLLNITDNRVRRRVHVLPSPIRVSELRLRVQCTNGAPCAHVVAFRAYA